MTNIALIVFTKNRPSLLSITLNYLSQTPFPIIVLDDSTTSKMRIQTKKICNGFNNVVYHGKHAQRKVLQHISFLTQTNEFIRPLGLPSWNLGYNRNYALLLLNMLGVRYGMFIDDDIIVANPSIVEELFEKLDFVDFVGSKILGMPDDSVVGLLKRFCGMKSEEFVSGGFLAFRLSSITEYFLNYYNEDWIWVYLHYPEKKILRYGKVYQIPYYPFTGYTQKVIHQEFGELLFDGVYFANNKKALLLKESFWQDVIENRIKELSCIVNKCKSTYLEEISMQIYTILIEYLRKLQPYKFVHVFKKYFENLKIWRNILRETRFLIHGEIVD